MRARRPPPSGGPRGEAIVGAGYVAAVLANDTELLANYRMAFSAEELLEASRKPITLMARYLGYHIEKNTTEIGDALVRAAQHSQDVF